MCRSNGDYMHLRRRAELEPPTRISIRQQVRWSPNTFGWYFTTSWSSVPAGITTNRTSSSSGVPAWRGAAGSLPDGAWFESGWAHQAGES